MEEQKNSKSVLSLFRRLSTWRCPHFLQSAGACSMAPAAIDRYLLPAGRWAANPMAAVDRRDRQTDGRTSDRYTEREKLRMLKKIGDGKSRQNSAGRRMGVHDRLTKSAASLYLTTTVMPGWSNFCLSFKVKERCTKSLGGFRTCAGDKNCFHIAFLCARTFLKIKYREASRGFSATAKLLLAEDESCVEC